MREQGWIDLMIGVVRRSEFGYLLTESCNPFIKMLNDDATFAGDDLELLKRISAASKGGFQLLFEEGSRDENDCKFAARNVARRVLKRKLHASSMEDIEYGVAKKMKMEHVKSWDMYTDLRRYIRQSRSLLKQLQQESSQLVEYILILGGVENRELLVGVLDSFMRFHHYDVEKVLCDPKKQHDIKSMYVKNVGKRIKLIPSISARPASGSFAPVQSHDIFFGCVKQQKKRGSAKESTVHVTPSSRRSTTTADEKDLLRNAIRSKSAIGAKKFTKPSSKSTISPSSARTTPHKPNSSKRKKSSTNKSSDRRSSVIKRKAVGVAQTTQDTSKMKGKALVEGTCSSRKYSGAPRGLNIFQKSLRNN